MRYFLSVHQMHTAHMEKLEARSRKYIIIWLGIQTHGVSDAAIFHPHMFKTKMPFQLYLEAHAGNYAMIRSKGDKVDQGLFCQDQVGPTKIPHKKYAHLPYAKL